MLILIIFGGLSFLLGIVLGITAYKFQSKKDPIVEMVNELLPQSQCAQCGYSGCYPYAEAIIQNSEKINKCIPGGSDLIIDISNVLNIGVPEEHLVMNNKKKYNTVWIDEKNCVGCSKCAIFCPVDAIVGAPNFIHTVLQKFCTGCDICVSHCPTNCGLKCLFIKNKISNISLTSLPLPDKFFIFIKGDLNHIKLRVKINQRVLRGQPLLFSNDFNVPMHAPTSGWIEDISFNSNFSEKYKNNIKITVSSDYLDQWIKLKPIKNYKEYTPEKLIKIINNSGIIGPGGGGFSSAKKLILSINKANTLIVNAVESEPYITSDNCLINNYTDAILTGCKIISWITKIKSILIAVQEDSIESISKIYSMIKNEPLFKICILKKKYPGGSSKVLIKSLTGKEIPYGKHSIDIGYLVFNVATIFSIKRAIVNGEPLTERIVTFLGEKSFLSGNFWIRIGTPIKYFLTDNKLKKCFIASVFSGGPFMGKRINDANDSILKNTNCISIFLKKEKSQKISEETCIRCSYCSSVCPVNLLPQQLYWYSKSKNHKQTKKHYILDCIECKACEKVCPSYIPLVKYFKREKIFLKNNFLEENRKKIALIRFKEREKRLLNTRKIMNINYDSVYSTEKKDKNIHDVNRNIRRKIVKAAIERMQDNK